MPSAVPPSNDADVTESTPKAATAAERDPLPALPLADSAEAVSQKTPDRVQPLTDLKQKSQSNAISLVLAVFWSFFGVRRSRDMEADAASLNPLHLAAAGVIGMLSFVAILLLVVHLVLR